MIRNLQESDIGELKEMYDRRGFNFGLPDLTKKLPVEKVLIDRDRVVMAALLRPTTEAYILCDPLWQTPWMRWVKLQELHAEVLKECRELDIEDTQAVLDPPIERAFGRRLLALGWGRHTGTLYSRKAWEPTDRKVG